MCQAPKSPTPKYLWHLIPKAPKSPKGDLGVFGFLKLLYSKCHPQLFFIEIVRIKSPPLGGFRGPMGITNQNHFPITTAIVLKRSIKIRKLAGVGELDTIQ